MRLARYTLALNAMCMDPRQFHGHDLIGTLQHHEPPTDYEFALTALAACNAQAHVRKRQMRRLLEIAHAVQEQNVGELGTYYRFSTREYIYMFILNHISHITLPPEIIYICSDGFL